MRAPLLYVHTLRFASPEDLERSVREVLASEFIEDCLVEAESLQLRFLAPPKRAAAVVERVYLHGGLSWCSRHPL